MATCIFNNVWHDYPPSNQPLSTQEAEDLLLENDDLSTTIYTTAYGLVSTIHRHAAQFTQQLRESEQPVQNQWELVAQRDEELACLRTGRVEALASFISNQGCVNYVIPTSDGALVVPHFV